MRLVDVDIQERGDRKRVLGTIERQRTGERIQPYFEYDAAAASSPSAAADAFAAAMLLPSMRAGEPCEVVPPISAQLSFSLPRLRDIFHTWWPKLVSRVDVSTTPRPAAAEAIAPRAGTFFSGGVDSFYSLLKHKHGAGTLSAPMTYAIFMRGVEMRLEWTKGAEGSQAWAQSAARGAGAECFTGETNIRTVLQGREDNLHWERNYHGSALAAIGLSVGPQMGYVCIPSAFSYNHLVPHGSSALTDEMYSTERSRIMHDGSEVTRAHKVARMLEWDRDLVLSHLRVCFMNSGGAYNCGRCYKCVRTAIPLRVLGVWDKAITFPDKSSDHWEEVVSNDHPALTEENLKFAQERGGDAKLISMLERIVQRRRRKEATHSLMHTTPLWRLAPLARRLGL